ncbi:hypothetical protein [uncultured Alistipes sp.]|uniref:hypothetical protein n=1 Tax=uncultured Alistipes sp. TaxID=538949 RepID=UPI003207886F
MKYFRGCTDFLIEKDSRSYLTEKRRFGQTGKSHKRIFEKISNRFLMRPTVIIGKLFSADYGLYKSIQDFRSKNQLQPFNIQYYVRMQNSYIENTSIEERDVIFLP